MRPCPLQHPNSLQRPLWSGEDGASSGSDWALAFAQEPCSIWGRQMRDPKRMLSPVPLHSNILSCKSCPLGSSRKKHQQRSDVLSFRTAQTPAVALPAVEVAALPQAPCQLGREKNKNPQISKCLFSLWFCNFTEH